MSVSVLLAVYSLVSPVLPYFRKAIIIAFGFPQNSREELRIFQLLFRHTAVKHKGLVWSKTPPAMSEMTQERTARSVLPYHQLNNLMWIQLAFKLVKLNLLHTQLLFRTEAPHHHHHLLTGVSPSMIGAQMTSKLRKLLSPAQIPSAQGRGAGATG